MVSLGKLSPELDAEEVARYHAQPWRIQLVGKVFARHGRDYPGPRVAALIAAALYAEGGGWSSTMASHWRRVAAELRRWAVPPPVKGAWSLAAEAMFLRPARSFRG